MISVLNKSLFNFLGQMYEAWLDNYHTRLKQSRFRHKDPCKFICQKLTSWWISPVVENVFFNFWKHGLFQFRTYLQFSDAFLLIVHLDDFAISFICHEFKLICDLRKENVLDSKKFIDWKEALFFLILVRFNDWLVLIWFCSSLYLDCWDVPYCLDLRIW